MGYFSNGTEGQSYEEQYCSKCVHRNGPHGDTGCAVWFAHLLHNYKECNNPDSILHILIPRESTGWNGQCKMFYAGEAEPDPIEESERLRKNINPAYKEWATSKGIL